METNLSAPGVCVMNVFSQSVFEDRDNRAVRSLARTWWRP